PLDRGVPPVLVEVAVAERDEEPDRLAALVVGELPHTAGPEVFQEFLDGGPRSGIGRRGSRRPVARAERGEDRPAEPRLQERQQIRQRLPIAPEGDLEGVLQEVRHWYLGGKRFTSGIHERDTPHEGTCAEAG